MIDRKIKLSPLVRMRMIFGHEIQRTSDDIYGDAYIQRLANVANSVGQSTNLTFRSLIIIDFIIFMFFSGKNIDLPGLSIKLKDLPFTIEILLFVSSLGVFFWSYNFVTHQGYGALLSEACQNKLSSTSVDETYLKASYVEESLVLKMFQSAALPLQVEYFSSNQCFRTICTIARQMLGLMALVLPLLHVTAVVLALKLHFESDVSSWIRYFLSAFVIATNGAACFIILLFLRDFEFEMTDDALIGKANDHSKE